MSINNATAQPAPDDATAAISATVDDIMEWSGNFAPIDVGTMTAQADTLTGSADVTLYTNGDVEITADNTVTSKLVNVGGDDLVTKYKLEYDGNGVAASGGSTVDYTLYSGFLGVGSAVTHIAGDGAVQVTLSVEATNAAGTLADSGAYTATQTLTATWAP